ncbi:GL15284 [Drosophila persimilis]|uniref:GL15284 n=1 Tax=Drosophila persimilis TaxID=7234 RepID=B4HCF2_DROPE|nr:GL15284 [Drosophila persimilis]
MTWKTEWYRTVFPDEKRFTLDGPDGFNYYFHDLRKKEHHLTRRHSREEGIMVWGAISYYGTFEIQFVSCKMNAIRYKELLQMSFPYFSNILKTLHWTFQQDNAPIHTARLVKTKILH